MVAATPSWTEYGCPISPQGSQGSTREGLPAQLNSASSPSNSDNNHYQSPALSPGDWNVASPSSVASSQYHGSVHSYSSSMNGSPNSAPAVMDSSRTSTYSARMPPNLPANLGTKEAVAIVDKKVLESINKEFLGKSSLDQGKERAANRRALALIKEATDIEHGLRAASYGGHSIAAPLTVVRPTTVTVPDGRERLASSTRKKKKAIDEDFETVDDFKCQYDRDREKWAQRMALRMYTGVKGMV